MKPISLAILTFWLSMCALTLLDLLLTLNGFFTGFLVGYVSATQGKSVNLTDLIFDVNSVNSGIPVFAPIVIILGSLFSALFVWYFEYDDVKTR